MPHKYACANTHTRFAAVSPHSVRARVWLPFACQAATLPQWLLWLLFHLRLFRVLLFLLPWVRHNPWRRPETTLEICCLFRLSEVTVPCVLWPITQRTIQPRWGVHILAWLVFFCWLIMMIGLK